MNDDHRDTVERIARFNEIDPVLVWALVLTESSGNTFAIRPEVTYPYLWDVASKKPFRKMSRSEAASKTPPPDFHALAGTTTQEWLMQQSSIGLCQVMGALAREHGFKGPYLTALVDPEINLTIGVRYLCGLLAWSGSEPAKALGAYNAGKGGALSHAGKAYAAKVLLRRDALMATP